MPTSTSRGRCNWACPAALITGTLLVVPGFCVVATAGTLLIVVCVSGAGLTVGCATEVTKVGVVGTGTVLTTVGVVGKGTELTTVGVGGGRDAGGSVFVAGGGGSLIVVGPPTGPVQTTPPGQHPMIPLLASAQTVWG